METPTTSPASSTDWKSLFMTLLGKLGVTVPDGASDSDIATLVDQFKAPAKPAPAADPKGAKPAGDGDAPPETMTAGEKFIYGQLQKLQGSREDDAKQALILTASSQGKVIPLGAEEIKLTPLSVLKVMVDKLPAGTVPLSAAQRAGGGADTVTLTAEEKQLCVTLGVDEKAFLEDKKKNPATARTAKL